MEYLNPPAADIMPMQIGAVRNATKPSSSAKAFSIENLPLRGTRAVGCYMVHVKNTSRNLSKVICIF